jgi:cytochrome c oxidase assembly factor CtaG
MKTITILIGLLGLVLGTGLILPALAKVRDFGTMPSGVVVPYTLGIVLAVAGMSSMVCSLTRPKAAKPEAVKLGR